MTEMTAHLQPAFDTYKKLLEAWNGRDADAFASVFTADGSAIGFDGSQMNGRTEIAATLGAIFADHPTANYVAHVREIRALRPGVVLVRAVAGLVARGVAELSPGLNAVQSVVVVDDGGTPRIALFQNTPAAFHGRPALSQQLTEELTGVVQSGEVVSAASR
jgi:uncharacterized protein (TIGR02246 family)